MHPLLETLKLLLLMVEVVSLGCCRVWEVAQGLGWVEEGARVSLQPQVVAGAAVEVAGDLLGR